MKQKLLHSGIGYLKGIRYLLTSLTFLVLFLLFFSGMPAPTADAWGFYGHRRINRMAVFTLPPEMLVFYKKNIDFITEHAVDPDKRRYATKHEAVRHYIDLDRHGEFPFLELPRRWEEAIMKYTEVQIVQSRGDTISLFSGQTQVGEELLLEVNAQLTDALFSAIAVEHYRPFFRTNILAQYYEDEWLVPCDSLRQFLGQSIDCQQVIAHDTLTEHGILPYNLTRVQKQLTEAFKQNDAKRILRLSAEIGHYIGDAHVPLHTTENYNGQLTDQRGIHAFWESRIPELFADEQYDYLVGKAEYIEEQETFFWDIVLTSHSYVDSVLLIEKDLSQTFPEDQQYCYDERLNRTIRTYCRDYAEAYQTRMNGMVEDRMRASILALGNVWYTAWVDAGSPDLNNLDPTFTKADEEQQKALEAEFQGGEIKGREH